MSRDFYEKYEEYMSVMAERKNRQLSSGLKPYSTAVTVERHQLANFIEKAVQETAEWNKKMNQDRYVGLHLSKFFQEVTFFIVIFTYLK